MNVLVNPSHTEYVHFTVNPVPTEPGDEYTTAERSNIWLLFYILIGVLALLVTALVPVLVLLCYCCYSYRNKIHKKKLTTPKHIVNRQTMIPTTTGSRCISVLPSNRERGEWTTSSEKMMMGSKVESSCATESTCTQLSSPESTV